MFETQQIVAILSSGLLQPPFGLLNQRENVLLLVGLSQEQLNIFKIEYVSHKTQQYLLSSINNFPCNSLQQATFLLKPIVEQFPSPLWLSPSAYHSFTTMNTMLTIPKTNQYLRDVIQEYIYEPIKRHQSTKIKRRDTRNTYQKFFMKQNIQLLGLLVAWATESYDPIMLCRNEYTHYTHWQYFRLLCINTSRRLLGWYQQILDKYDILSILLSPSSPTISPYLEIDDIQSILHLSSYGDSISDSKPLLDSVSGSPFVVDANISRFHNNITKVEQNVG